MHMLSVLHTIAFFGLLAVLAVAVLPAALYCGLLTAAAPFGLRRCGVRAGTRRRRFAVLVPAHDEQAVLGLTLESLLALDYPRRLVDVWVVADNCRDGTAALARAYDAKTRERHDSERTGKGYALAWLLRQMADEDEQYDGYLIVDADSVLSPNYLTEMDACLGAGERAAQGYYTVLDSQGTRAESLRGAALALVHFLRPAAKMALGASCGLKGNGMCFARAVIVRFGWPTAGLAEDVEFNLLLAGAGIRVAFVPNAVVRAEIPPSLRASASQNRRWEAGRVATIGRALPILLKGLRRRNVAAIDAAVEQLVPPLSAPVALAVLCLAGGGALGARLVWLPALLTLAVFAAYVATGLVLAGATRAQWRALLFAPVYVGWKTLLYAKVLVGPRQRVWVRTRRRST